MKKNVATAHAASLALFCLLAAATSATARAQNESDREILDKARALYVTGPIPSSISCDINVDWDAFFTTLKLEQTDQIRARLQKFKAMRIHVVSRGADQTEVTFDDVDPSIAKAGDGVRQQLEGFFTIYWSEAFGQFLAKRGEAFQLTPTADGYEQTADAGSGKVVVEIDKAFLVTQLTLNLSTLNAVVKPSFKAGTDGLLRLSSAEETIEMGATKMVVDFGWDYQKVSGFDIPQHLHMALPGSFAFDYTLTGCEVNAPKPAAKIPPPRSIP
jgi:hypothetical protein